MQYQEGSDSSELSCSDESKLDNSGAVIRVDTSYKHLTGSEVYTITNSTP